MSHNLNEDCLDSNVVGDKVEVLHAVEGSFLFITTHPSFHISNAILL